jgi:hypothetical protein
VTGYGLEVRGSNPGGGGFSTTVQTGPGAQPASCTMGTASFPGVESGRSVTLTPHPLLVPRSKKQSKAIPLLSLRAFVAYEKGETYLKDKYVTVHNKCFTIQPSTSMFLATPVRRRACCLSALSFTFLYAGSSIQNAIRLVCFVNFSLHPTHKQKCNEEFAPDSNSSTSITIQN